MIASLADLYAASGDQEDLTEAERSAEWVLAHRALPGGGFRHDEHDAAGPYLGDTLAMGQAFLALYQVTAERAGWSRRRLRCRSSRQTFLRRMEAGYVTSKARRTAFRTGFRSATKMSRWRVSAG